MPLEVTALFSRGRRQRRARRSGEKTMQTLRAQLYLHFQVVLVVWVAAG